MTSANDLTQAMQRIEAIAASMDHTILDSVAGLDEAKGVDQQPWLILGCSDGMGLNTAIAAIQAGVLKRGVGVYWEPAHFLEFDDDGNPVSPVHRARVENAEALAIWAKENYGAELEIVFANVVLTPPRNLKGEPNGELAALPADLLSTFEGVREKCEIADAIVVNSVAFGKWICPREGHEPIVVPSVDFDGQLVETRTKKFHARGYEEALDTMGRNHLAILESVRELGWLGPLSLTAFYTWAGGSQNVSSLEGIYGKGALGDAKMIAERDVAKFRIDHPVEEFGAHAIVRLPAFLSAALMGIPGGGLFGLVSRRVLDEKGLFDDMPALASKMIRKLFGPEWIRENPISQIELDLAECLYVDQIDADVREAHRRVAEHIEATGASLPFDVATSAKVLDGLVPSNYVQLLGRFRPGADDSSATFEIAAAELRYGLGAAVLPFGERARRFEEVEVLGELEGTASVSWAEVDNTLTFEAVVDGKAIARGRIDYGAPEVGAPNAAEVGDAIARVASSEIGNLVAWSSELLGQPDHLRTTFGAAPTGDLLAYRKDETLTVIDTEANLVLTCAHRA